MIKQIPGYEGYSIVRETSQVLSHYKTIRDQKGRILTKVIDYSYSKPMKPLLVQEKGRSQIRPHLILRKNGKRRKVLIHRLVGLTFVENPNPSKFKILEHIDDNNSNYHYSNLRWSTHKINMVTRSLNQDKDLLIIELQQQILQLKEKLNEN